MVIISIFLEMPCMDSLSYNHRTLLECRRSLLFERREVVSSHG